MIEDGVCQDSEFPMGYIVLRGESIIENYSEKKLVLLIGSKNTGKTTFLHHLDKYEVILCEVPSLNVESDNYNDDVLQSASFILQHTDAEEVHLVLFSKFLENSTGNEMKAIDAVNSIFKQDFKKPIILHIVLTFSNIQSTSLYPKDWKDQLGQRNKNFCWEQWEIARRAFFERNIKFKFELYSLDFEDETIILPSNKSTIDVIQEFVNNLKLMPGKAEIQHCPLVKVQPVQGDEETSDREKTFPEKFQDAAPKVVVGVVGIGVTCGIVAATVTVGPIVGAGMAIGAIGTIVGLGVLKNQYKKKRTI